uniref:Uncharacterized protein n=1 Tax=Caenorhabditis japonica TaxID=281687 RepID=A0A8R1HVN4_CAEJA
MSTSTIDPPVGYGLQIVGYVALLVSCIAFGTMFVPLRRRNCKDGMFVQWIECSVVFIVGCVFYAARGFPKFEPIACIGGLLGTLLIFVRHVESDDVDNEYDVASKEMENRAEQSDSDDQKIDLKGLARKMPYILMAMILACLHGLMMSPIEYLKQKNPSTDSWQVFDYIFPFYTSVFLFSTVYFLLYCLILRRRACVERNLIIPSIGYGILWTT